MGRLLEIVTPLHKATKRDYLARMVDDKVHCMMKAKEYEYDYWDGDRRYGYGGYKFIEGRWSPVAKALIDIYGLKNGSRVLDVGCGKAFLLYEMKKILPDLQVAGFDISRHGSSRGTIPGCRGLKAGQPARESASRSRNRSPADRHRRRRYGQWRQKCRPRSCRPGAPRCRAELKDREMADRSQRSACAASWRKRRTHAL